MPIPFIMRQKMPMNAILMVPGDCMPAIVDTEQLEASWQFVAKEDGVKGLQIVR